jgi:hypothetical protein
VRALVLILMMALLPIRMWAADGMSVQMAAQGAPAASMAMDSMGDMPSDCPMQAVGGEQDEPSKGSAAATCLSCQLCAAVGVSAVIPFRSDISPARPALLASSSFDSADPVQDHKPPIS